MERDWERRPQLQLGLAELRGLFAPAFPFATITHHELITTGLANTNVRVWLSGYDGSFVLRVNTRDASAAKRECAITRYLAAHQPAFPVPELCYCDADSSPPYSIWRFVSGELLQTLFHTLPAPELIEIAASCGQTLAPLAQHRFAKSGGLSAELEVTHEYGEPSRFVPEFIREALFNQRAGQRLGLDLRDALWRVVERASPELAELDGRYSLVHGDYKRSNLLLARVKGNWRVAAVLDWEFAFAGPALVDAGLFLRAGSALPPGFAAAFVAGYRAAGGKLPTEWLRLSRLIDLLSQMTFLNEEAERPRVVAETIGVVKETLRILS